MKTKSCKAKGRKLQNLVRDLLKKAYPNLLVHVAIMGEQGIDVSNSKFGFECKNKEGFKYIYDAYEQAVKNCKEKTTPVLVIKSNNKKPLAVVDAEWFIQESIWLKE